MGNFWDLLLELVKADFKLRYKNSVLGLVWVLLKPLLLFLILYGVFSFVFRFSDPNYKLNLLLGLIIFYFFSEATTRGLSALIERSDIILKVNFPRHIAIAAPVINAYINFLFNLAVFFIFWAFTPTPITWWWLTFPLYIIILGLFVVGFSLFTSIWYIKVRDLATVWEVLLSLLFYITPIVYPMSIIPIKYHQLWTLNPLTAIVRDARYILVDGSMPGFYSIIYVGGLGLLLVVIGWWYFRTHVKRVAEDF